jgi:hypothetical protein
MNNNVKIDDLEIPGSGQYVLFQLDNVSYYPTKKVASRIALNIYGVDLVTKGLLHSEKYREEAARQDRVVDPDRPLAHCDVEGDFILFLPDDNEENAWGLMDIRKVNSRRSDLNLSIVSPLALMPYRLHIVEGGAEGGAHPQFSVIDREGSGWTLHCKHLNLQKK